MGEPMILSLAFWKPTLERAVKTAAQTLLSLWLVGDKILNAFEIDWGEAGGVALGAAIVSVLTSMASAPVGDTGTPSLVHEE